MSFPKVTVVTEPPEKTAYAFAMVSRSNKSIEDRLRYVEKIEEREGGTTKFFDEFYWKYGHGSIADNAMVAMAIEGVSMQLAMILEDDPEWRGQEQSTRYQDYSNHDWIDRGFDSELDRFYETQLELYQIETDALTQDVAVQLSLISGSDAQFRALRGRVFDVTRVLLPMGMLTNVVQVLSARSLERQVMRLKLAETPEADTVANLIVHELRDVLPSLLKYTDPDPRALLGIQGLKDIVSHLVGTSDNWTVPRWGASVFKAQNMEVELIANAIFQYSAWDYTTALERALRLGPAKRGRVAHEVLRYAEMIPGQRLTQLGERLIVEVTMDTGSMRDLYRNRRMSQLRQNAVFHDTIGAQSWLTTGLGTYGLVIPEGMADRWDRILHQMPMVQARSTVDTLPLGHIRRAVFRMDYEQLKYVLKQRSAPGGHFSYRTMMHSIAGGAKGVLPKSMHEFLTVTPLSGADFLNR